MAKNSNTSDNSEPETELSDFSTLKPFKMEPRKSVSDKKLYTVVMSSQGHFDQTEVCL